MPRPDRVENAQAVFPNVDTGARRTNFGLTLVNDDFPTAPRERNRGRETPEPATGNDHLSAYAPSWQQARL